MNKQWRTTAFSLPCLWPFVTHTNQEKRVAVVAAGVFSKMTGLILVAIMNLPLKTLSGQSVAGSRLTSHFNNQLSSLAASPALIPNRIRFQVLSLMQNQKIWAVEPGSANGKGAIAEFVGVWARTFMMLTLSSAAWSWTWSNCSTWRSDTGTQSHASEQNCFTCYFKSEAFWNCFSLVFPAI